MLIVEAETFQKCSMLDLIGDEMCMCLLTPFPIRNR